MNYFPKQNFYDINTNIWINILIIDDCNNFVNEYYNSFSTSLIYIKI